MNEELMALLGNLNSITEQIKQLMGGEAPVEGEMQEGMDESDAINMQKLRKLLKENGYDEDDKMEKEDDEESDGDIVEKQDEGVSTGSDDAEERIEDQPEMNVENVEEVAKAIVKALRIKKSKKGNPLNKEIQTLKNENKEMKKALEGIFEGLGIADEIQKSLKVEKEKKKARPMNNPNEIQKTLDLIKDSISSNGNSSKIVNTNNNTEFRKSLIDSDGQLLKGLFQKNK